jgi:hypothetical protein
MGFTARIFESVSVSPYPKTTGSSDATMVARFSLCRPTAFAIIQAALCRDTASVLQ